MTEYSAQTQDFINTFMPFCYSSLNSEIVRAVIDQMGGEKNFIDVYQRIIDNGSCEGVEGFLFADERVEFFEDNKKTLLAFTREAVSKFGKVTANDYIFDEVQTGKYNDYDRDEIAEAIYLPPKPQANLPSGDELDYAKVDVSSVIVYLFIDEVCNAYSAMIKSVR